MIKIVQQQNMKLKQQIQLLEDEKLASEELNKLVQKIEEDFTQEVTHIKLQNIELLDQCKNPRRFKSNENSSKLLQK